MERVAKCMEDRGCVGKERKGKEAGRVR